MINLFLFLSFYSSSRMPFISRYYSIYSATKTTITIITDDGYRVGRNDAYCLATIVILITFVTCILNHHVDLRQRLVGARMRIACSAAIYRKSLRMSKLAVTQTSAGNVVNLLSNDVSRLDYGFIFVHYIWILPLQGNLNPFYMILSFFPSHLKKKPLGPIICTLNLWSLSLFFIPQNMLNSFFFSNCYLFFSSLSF